MEGYVNNNQSLDQYEHNENLKVEVKDTTELTNNVIGENLDVKGGRVLDVPDFVQLAEMGFDEDELQTLLKLRRRFEEGGSDFTPEHQRLRFARWMYRNGKLDS